MTAVKPHGEAVADARRDQMLMASAHLIAERGFSDTRIADVAERVGASPALVIYYFGTKDSLLTEALRWSERSFYAAVEEMLRETPSLRARIENLVEACLPESEDVPDDWGLWFDLWAQAFRHPGVKKDRAELDQQWRDLVSRVVAAGVEAGEIEPLPDLALGVHPPSYGDPGPALHERIDVLGGETCGDRLSHGDQSMVRAEGGVHSGGHPLRLRPPPPHRVP